MVPIILFRNKHLQNPSLIVKMGVSKVVSIEFPILMTKLTFMPQISIVLNSKTLSNKGPIRNMFIIRSCRENDIKKSFALLKPASTKNMDRRIYV
jgi:hypothetical protein